MTAEPRQITRPLSRGRKFLRFFARYWGALLLGAASVFFAVHYMPQVNLSLIDSETMFVPLFYNDVVRLHHAAADWQWGGDSSLFPELVIFFLLDFFSNNDWFAVEGTSAALFLCWLGVCAALPYAFRRPHPLGLISMLFLLIAAEACDFSLSRDVGTNIQDSFFQPVYHAGAGICWFAGVGLLFHQISGGKRLGFGILLATVFLATTSDALFVVLFVVPALAALAVLGVVFFRNWKRYGLLALGILLATAAGFFAAPYLFPVPLETGNYLYPNGPVVHDSVMTLWSQAIDPAHRFFGFLLACDIAIILGGIVAFFAFCFFKAARKMSPAVLAMIVLGPSSIASVFGAVLITGNYQGMEENRYFVVPLIMPFLLIALGLHAVIRWRPWIENLFAAIAAVLIVGWGLIPQSPSAAYLGLIDSLPFIKDVMKKNNISNALVSYWRSDLITFASGGAVPARSITNDGTINTLCSTMRWYGKGIPMKDAPRFRLIIDPDGAMQGSFGPPDQDIKMPGGEEFWVYSEEHAIRYNEYFDRMSNAYLDDGHTLRFTGAALSSGTGKIDGTSRVAVAGHDGEGYETYGPYLVLKPARYRVTYRYVYLTPPDAGKTAAFDLLVHIPGKDDVDQDVTQLPYAGPQPQVFTEEFVVRNPGQTYEMRIDYPGSGTLRIDSLDVTCLVP